MIDNEKHAYRSRRRGMDPAKKRLLTIVGSGLGLLAVAVGITCAVYFGKNGKPSSASSVSGIVTEETGYNKDANKLDASLYPDTILDSSEDAGDDYVDNTLFIGDSNTYRYMVYGKTTLANDIGIVGMGLQSVLSEKCVKFVGYSDYVTIPEAVTIMQPQRIVISFGTNNAGGSWTADYFAQQYSAVLDEIEKAYPYADIIISAVPPVGQYHENQSITMTTIDEFNVALAKLAKERGCKFLNVAETLKDENTGFAKDGYTISDGIHLSQTGVEALFSYVRTHSYITEDRRPTLTSVPKRDELEPYVITNEKPYSGTVSGHGSSSKTDGVPVVFNVNDAAMGSLQGTMEQSAPAGENCEAVTAVPKEGYVFSYWSCTYGRISDTGSPNLTFTVPAEYADTTAIVVTANFTKSGNEITVTSSDKTVGTAGIKQGSDLLSGMAVPEGQSIELYAQVNDGYGTTYNFVGWFIGDTIISSSLDFVYTPTGPAALTAVFQRIAFTFNVNTDGSAGCSVAQSSNNGVLTVQAYAGEGYTFTGWEINGSQGSYTNQSNPMKLNIDQNLTIIAHFKANTPSSTPTPPEESSSSSTTSDSPAASDSSSSSNSSAD